MKNYMNWFTGVVEDRFDPDELGRVRVRIFGLHTDDLSKIPTTDLPWAHIVMPTTSASISGVGLSPTGLVEGSWVVGFFADGDNCQDPVILGSLHGYPTQKNSERKAFKDSDDKFPRWYDDTDVSYTAREKWHDHSSYVARTASTVKGVETATKPNMSTTSSEAEDEARKSWDEPAPRNGVEGNYPYVHVWESESGIVREHDDTPGGTRITEYHPSGTFYEIYSDGKKMTKVVGDNFEIIIHDDNLLVRGNQNVTIEGNARHMVKGNYTMEVTGDYNLKVHGSRNTKIASNDSMEILGNYNLNVQSDFITRVGANQTLIIGADKTETINGKSSLSVVGVGDMVFMDTLSIFSTGAQKISTNSTQNLLAKSALDISTSDTATINAKGNLIGQIDGSLNVHAAGSAAWTSDSSTTVSSTGNFSVTASKINLN